MFYELLYYLLPMPALKDVILYVLFRRIVG